MKENLSRNINKKIFFAELIRRFDVVNRGFAGWNTTNVLAYLPELFAEPSASSPKIEYLVSTEYLWRLYGNLMYTDSTEIFPGDSLGSK